MQRTLRAAQRAASSASRSAASTTTTKPTSTRAVPLPYAPPQRGPRAADHLSPPLPTAQSTPTRPTTPAQPLPASQVKPGSPAYNTAAGKYTRSMIAMPILLLTSYVLYGRFVGGAEEKTLPGAEGQPRLVVLDK